MANHTTGAQRYNDRKDKIFAEAKVLKKKYGTEDKEYDNRSEAMKKSMAKKMGGKLDRFIKKNKDAGKDTKYL